MPGNVGRPVGVHADDGIPLAGCAPGPSAHPGRSRSGWHVHIEVFAPHFDDLRVDLDTRRSGSARKPRWPGVRSSRQPGRRSPCSSPRSGHTGRHQGRVEKRADQELLPGAVIIELGWMPHRMDPLALVQAQKAVTIFSITWM